ncbi:hypothetical protein GOSPT_025_01090 [Gordonia sputi NBRC 100414]|uniref:Phosphoribosyltransferase domain-containing protein n=1 Tax=Gordonia sputi NBRC 100414 TaxID=1089453 RepID=H5TX67_9ACTN|nr:hypothetical protein GOSPT_025_01090 [Gordonia sputi NBRC 100414]
MPRDPHAYPFHKEPEFDRLVQALAEAVTRHPAYSSASTIISAPSSRVTGESLAESLSLGVAKATGKNLIFATCRPHEPRKGPNPPDLSGMISVKALINGSCIVLDDVLHTGHTLNETARAALRAGATSVYGLVGAKTMRA